MTVEIDISDVYWYDDRRWWLYILSINTDVDVSVGDDVEVTNEGNVILSGKVVNISTGTNNKILWLESEDYLFFLENGGVPAAVVGEYEVDESISNIVTEADVKLQMADLPFFEVGDNVEVWIGWKKIIEGNVASIDRRSKSRKCVIYSHGRELITHYVNMVYYNEDVFDIVKDMVERVTDLTVEGQETGITLDRFVAKDFLINLVEDLSHIAGYQVRVIGKTLYFEPLGETSAKYELNTNVCRFSNWNVDMREIVNELYLAGSELTYHKEDEFTGDGTTKTFDLTYRPVGNIKVVVAGNELVGGVDYVIDNDKPSITFTTAPPSATAPNIFVSYDYGIGILVRARSDESIMKYGVHDRKLRFDWIKDFNTARNVAWGVIRMFSLPYTDVVANMTIPRIFKSDISIGKRVHCVDNVNKEDMWLVVKGIQYKNGHAYISLGSSLMTFDKWVTEVEDRLRALEKEKLGKETLTQYYLFTEDIKVSVTQTLYRLKTKKIISGMRFGRDLVGVAAMGIKYGSWETVYEVT